ncbi:MAG: hypothetical protein AAF654_08630 [Myxococcota bacterium]
MGVHRHQHAVLAKNGIGQVNVCCCGTVQLTLGPVTVRIALDQLETVACLLNDAVDAVPTVIAESIEDDAPALHN